MFSSAYPLNKIDGLQKRSLRFCMMILTLRTDFDGIFLSFFSKKILFSSKKKTTLQKKLLHLSKN